MPAMHRGDLYSESADLLGQKADHCFPIVHCNNIELGGAKLTHKILDHYLHHNLVMLPLLWCFFAQLLILEYIAMDHHHNLISSLLYYPWLLHKISSQSVHNFLNNVIHKQISRQTNLRYWKYNLLCGFGFCCLMTPCLSKDIRCQIFPTCVSSKWCIFTFICATCSFLPLSFRCACPSGDESSPNLCNSSLITLLIDSSLFQFSVWLVLSGVDVAAGRSLRW